MIATFEYFLKIGFFHPAVESCSMAVTSEQHQTEIDRLNFNFLRGREECKNAS